MMTEMAMIVVLEREADDLPKTEESRPAMKPRKASAQADRMAYALPRGAVVSLLWGVGEAMMTFRIGC